MIYKLNDKHIDNVMELAAPERYDYFIRRVADWRAVWVLGEHDGFVTASDDEGVELLPVWPHPHFAQLCAKDSWSGATPEQINLSEWLDTWTEQLTEKKCQIAVFPLPDGHGIPVDPTRIADDLRTELSRFR